MAYQNISIDRQGAVAWLTLDRASYENVVDPLLASEVKVACRELDQDKSVRVVVVTGAGDSFSAGTFPPPGLLGGSPGGDLLLERLHGLRMAEHVAELRKPTLAAVNGPAIGPGLELSMACDLRLAADTARFSLPHLQHGLLPWDGATQRLPRLIGRSRTLELLLTGRELDAETALQFGLVHMVKPAAELVKIAAELALEVASFGPIAAAYLKEAIWKGMDLSLEEGLRLEADLNVILQSTSDRAEGIRSFMERRAPIYHGR